MKDYHLNYSLRNINGEKWKDIIGHEGYYQVSNMGRIKAIARLVDRVDHRNGKVQKLRRQEQIIKPFLLRTGYPAVKLCVNSQTKNTTIHKQVGIHFVDNPNGYKFINHKKGIRTDNRAEELEWCTVAQNNQHAYDVLGKKPYWLGKKGKNHVRSKAINQIDKNTGKIIKRYASSREAERQTGIWSSGISHVLNNRLKSSGGFKWSFA